MTSRARGRGRSRGRSGPPQNGEARRPGAAAEARPQVGRGRSRGPPPQAAAAAPPAASPPPAAAPPTQQMSAMGLGDGAEQRGPIGRRGILSGFQEKKTRPEHAVNKTGAAGKKITISTNHFRLQTQPQFAVYQYNVSYYPEVDSKGTRHGMLNEHKELIGNTMAFDGMILYLPIKLPESVTKVTATRRSDDTTVELTIALTNKLPPDSPICVQLFNVVFRRVLKHIGMRQVGRNYYNTSNAIEIPQHKLELWPGFSTSILHYESSVLLQADVSHKVLRKTTVLDYLYNLFNSRKGDFYEEATKKLVGEIVLTRYNNKTYRIDDISWDGRPHDKFQTREGEVSFIEYYQKTYEKTIEDMDQPLLISRPKKAMVRKGMTGDVLLIPELCFLTGLSDEMRSDFHMMKDLATHTRVDPTNRQKQLQQFINDINGNEEASAELSGWALKFDNNLLKMDGRTLPGEIIYQRGTKYSYDPKSADWSREMRGAQLISTVNLDDWVILHTQRDTGIAKDFIETLKRVCGPMGIAVRNARNLLPLSDDRTETYLKAIREQMIQPPQLVVCILPTNRKDRYDSIKKLCCLESPVPSQVIVSRTISKKQMLMSVATKIGIQLNVKLGGEVWALEIPLKDLMVVGYDSYHDSVKKGQSVGGFVASLNQSLTKYHSRCTFQHTGMELVDGLKVCMTGALRKYAKENDKLPDRIIFYRDGVGDGQLPAVVDHEIPQFIQCFKDVTAGNGAEYRPKFAFIVVKKRVNSRFFMEDAKSRQLSNPPPGSVIDSEVTRPEWYDFFLISQSVRQGTVTPTHYNVVYDTSGLKPDHFQRLTYKLTHLYYNWPGTIRVPAPCQYAHKLAFLVGQSLHQQPKQELADKLFYL